MSQWIEQFALQLDTLPSQNLMAWREQQLIAFHQAGWPTRRNERWKYTNTQTLEQTNWQKVKSDSLPSLDDVTDVYRIVIHDGEVNWSQSHIKELSDKIIVADLSKIPTEYQSRIEQLLQQNTEQPLTQLNNAMLSQGVVIIVPKQVKLDKPIHLLVSTTTETVHAYMPLRHLVMVEDQAEVTLFEEYVSTSALEYWQHVVMQWHLASGARATHIKCQHEGMQASHTSQQWVHQAADSYFSSSLIALGGKLSRDAWDIALAGNGASCQCLGLYLPIQKQHFDQQLDVHHLANHGHSEQVFKGILSDQGTAVFNGQVTVAEKTIQNVAFQKNNNLLLSDKASINTKPCLEIYAEDVKCSHGATVGQLDEKSLFYLRSRGIDYHQACQMLKVAFAKEVLSKILQTANWPVLSSFVDERLQLMSHE